VLGLTVLIVGYFLVVGATTALRSRQLSEREGRFEAEIGALRERYERLEALHDYLASDEYVEAVAREQLGLVREGETSIVVIPAAPSGTPVARDPTEGELWWETLIR
jgi:cell division protein DivIC